MKKLIVWCTFVGATTLFSLSKAYAADTGSILALGDSLTAGLTRVAGVGIVCGARGNRVVAATDQRSCKGNGQEGVGGWLPPLKSLTGALIYN